ncbi:hypothetical protein IPN35_02775 [Candidatus Peregrinibacteria bacterium]|nr:MAG: hypothetical protein IPN35_02775 [Candidatus Peregrinibacteria bacterium]
MKKNTLWRITVSTGMLLFALFVAPMFTTPASAEENGAGQKVKKIVHEAQKEAHQEIRRDRFLERCDEQGFSEKKCKEKGVTLTKHIRELNKTRKMSLISNIVDAKKTCAEESGKTPKDVQMCMREKIKGYIKDRILKERKVKKDCHENLGEDPSGAEIQECVYGKIYNDSNDDSGDDDSVSGDDDSSDAVDEDTNETDEENASDDSGEESGDDGSSDDSVSGDDDSSDAVDEDTNETDEENASDDANEDSGDDSSEDTSGENS